jgi:hypothetical protein
MIAWAHQRTASKMRTLDCGADAMQTLEMPLLNFIIAIMAVGMVLYCINRFVPMEGRIKSVLNIVVILVLVVWCLEAFGVFDAMRGVRVPRVHG